MILCFSLATFRIHFNICHFNYMSWCGSVWVHPIWDPLCFLNLDNISFFRFGKFSDIISPNVLFHYFLSLFLSLFPSLPLSPINEYNLTLYVKENFKTQNSYFVWVFIVSIWRMLPNTHYKCVQGDRLEFTVLIAYILYIFLSV